MIFPPLACTVRGCGLPLARYDRSLRCPAGHAHDVARHGYLNLLQPQDRRSPDAGDSREVVHARARLLAAGVGRALVEAAVSRAAALDLGHRPVVVDLGSGTGDALGLLAATRPVIGVGIDLSVAAADSSARRFPELTWVVANADRRIPLLDGSVRLALSLHARRNPNECARILVPGGWLIVAVPAPDDLAELRALVQGHAVERDRMAKVIEEHAASFAVEERFAVRVSQPLDREILRDLVRSTYRGGRSTAAARVHSLATTEVTLASDVVLFTRVAGWLPDSC